MLQPSTETITTRLTRERVPCSFNKEELRVFLAVLQQRLDAAAEIEVGRFQQNQQTDEEFEHNKELLRQGYKLRPTVIGEDGRELYGRVEDIFDSPNFPEAVRSVYLNSEIPLKAVYNFGVRNSVEVFLDFSKPAIFDFNLMPGLRTPNETNYKVNGVDASWVNGLFHEIQSYMQRKKSIAPWLHEHSVYDFFLWFFGFPIGFWLCFNASPFLPEGKDGVLFLRAALYLYIFLIALVGLRALFHYSRWVFPMVEYRHPRSRMLKHRAVLAALSVGLIVAVMYDMLKAVAL